MNIFALFAFGLLIFGPACCGKKKCKVTEVAQEKVAVTTQEEAQPKQIKF